MKVVRLILSLLLLNVGCSKHMSVEEAKEVTAAFKQERFIPPPRKIQDVLSLLHQTYPDSSQVEARIALVQAKPPENSGSRELSQFFLQKGLAALELGMDPVEEFRTAMKYAGASADADLYRELAMAEFRYGNARAAIDWLETAKRKFPDKNFDQALLKVYANTGQMALAQQSYRNALAQVQSRLQKQRRADSSGKAVWGERVVNTVTAEYLELNGNYPAAEAARRNALAISGTLDRIRPTISDTLDLAHNLIKQGRPVESEVYARMALNQSLKNFGKKSDLTTKALQHIAAALSEQGRFSEAEQLERTAIDIRLQTGERDGSYQLIKYRINLARTLLIQEKWQEALKILELAKQQATGSLAYDKLFFWSPAYPLALLANEQYQAASEHLQRSLTITGAISRHKKPFKLIGLLAVAEVRLGNANAAIDHFRQARPWLLSTNESGEDSRFGQTMKRFVAEHYLFLLAEISGTRLEQDQKLDAVAEAFIIADVTKAQSVQAELLKSGARAAIHEPGLQSLARKEQDAQKQLAGLQSVLADMVSIPANQQIASGIRETEKKIALLEKAQASLQLEIAKQFPDYGSLSQARSVSLDEVQLRLRPGEALIAVYLSKHQSYAWGIPKQGRPVFTTVGIGTAEFKTMVYRLRAAFDSAATTFGQIPAFDVATSHHLYSLLLKPLASAWRESQHLIMVLHGPLNQLPMAVLVTEPVSLGKESGVLFDNYRAIPWLINKYAISASPSATTFVAQRSQTIATDTPQTFSGFGDPLFNQEYATKANNTPIQPLVETSATAMSPIHKRGIRLARNGQLDEAKLNSVNLEMLQPLPDSADEVLSIASALGADPKQDVFLRERATEHWVKHTDLSVKKILLFATHALIPGDLDGLTQPALALSSPGAVGGSEDGLLTMEEIMGLRLNADWVVLSACNSAAGAGEGAEAISGLGRAFFYAGTRALLVSHWSVETTSAKTLTTRLFTIQAENPRVSRALALQKSQIYLIQKAGLKAQDSGKTIINYAHPVFWAPFTLVGDG